MKKKEPEKKEKKPFEQRAYNFEIRATEEENGTGIITGRPIVYESVANIGPFDEVIEREALDGADLQDVRFLVNHDTSMIPLARSRRNTPTSTMQLTPDYEGLSVRVNLDIENNSTAKDLYSAIKRGDVTGMSFLFAVDKQSWENMESNHPTRRIEKIKKVLEVSAVTFPAYESTEINARSKEALENARKALENAGKLGARALDNAGELELLKEKTKLLGGL